MSSIVNYLERAVVSLAIGTGAGCCVCVLGISLGLASGQWVPLSQVPHIVRLGHPSQTDPASQPGPAPADLPHRPHPQPVQSNTAARLVVINTPAEPVDVNPVTRTLAALVDLADEALP